jgi:hypothetical protein
MSDTIHPMRPRVALLHIAQANALDMLTEMEGLVWRRLQERLPDDSRGFYFWLRAWEAKRAAGFDEIPVPLTAFGIRPARAPIILGATALHRYCVEPTGEIVLLSENVLPGAVSKATTLGIRLRA